MRFPDWSDSSTARVAKLDSIISFSSTGAGPPSRTAAVNAESAALNPLSWLLLFCFVDFPPAVLVRVLGIDRDNRAVGKYFDHFLWIGSIAESGIGNGSEAAIGKSKCCGNVITGTHLRNGGVRHRI